MDKNKKICIVIFFSLVILAIVIAMQRSNKIKILGKNVKIPPTPAIMPSTINEVSHSAIPNFSNIFNEKKKNISNPT